jgi:hypothetical protein
MGLLSFLSGCGDDAGPAGRRMAFPEGRLRPRDLRIEDADAKSFW